MVHRLRNECTQTTKKEQRRTKEPSGLKVPSLRPSANDWRRERINTSSSWFAFTDERALGEEAATMEMPLSQLSPRNPTGHLHSHLSASSSPPFSQVRMHSNRGSGRFHETEFEFEKRWTDAALQYSRSHLSPLKPTSQKHRQSADCTPLTQALGHLPSQYCSMVAKCCMPSRCSTSRVLAILKRPCSPK